LLKNFNFNLQTKIFFGSGERKYINQIFSKEKYKSVCVVIDHALVTLPVFFKFIDSMKCDYNIIECDISEPTYDSLEKKREYLNNKRVDAFIGIGGGSALDMAKGLSVLFNNPDPAIAYRGFDKFKEPIQPIIAIPTTAGTGSEITPNASFIDTISSRKMGINGKAIRPKYAVIDPELTISCPIKPTISAGVDSMVHAIEAFAAKNSNPISNIFAKEGFRLVFENLPILVDDLKNIELREKVMFGAFLSAIALMNSGTGPAAAMSYPLSVNYKVPHGIGGAIFLPHVIKHNISEGFYDYADLIKTNDQMTKGKLAYSFLDNLNKTWDKLDISNDLGEFGLYSSHIARFVSETMDLKAALDQNPVPFYESEIIQVLNNLIIK
jgi:alcohol dehydrogenase class IV